MRSRYSAVTVAALIGTSLCASSVYGQQNGGGRRLQNGRAHSDQPENFASVGRAEFSRDIGKLTDGRKDIGGMGDFSDGGIFADEIPLFDLNAADLVAGGRTPFGVDLDGPAFRLGMPGVVGAGRGPVFADARRSGAAFDLAGAGSGGGTGGVIPAPGAGVLVGAALAAAAGRRRRR